MPTAVPHHVVAAATNNFLIPNGTFFFELICFLVVLYILGKKIIPRITAMVDQRQATIRQQFEDAEAAKARLEAAEKEYAEALAETRRDASRLREQAQSERAEIVEAARSEAQSRVEEMLASAADRITAERQQAILALRNEIGELATTLAERIVHSSLRDDARQRQLVADFIAGVGASETVSQSASTGSAEPLLMQGASRKSLAGLRDRLPVEGDLAALSEQLYAVVSLLTTQASLRRALSDPATADVAKVRVVDALFSDRLGPEALEIVRAAARSRWSQPRDLLDSLEELAVDAALGVAEAAGQLDNVEDELFRFERILDAEPTLRAALTDRNLSGETKRGLLHTLLDGKVGDVTFALLERAVLEPRGRTIEHALRDLSELAAKRRERLIAHVTTATELSTIEQNDLVEALGRPSSPTSGCRWSIDPSLIGGLTVRIGDEFIDASVARQLDEARRKLTGGSGVRPHRS